MSQPAPFIYPYVSAEDYAEYRRIADDKDTMSPDHSVFENIANKTDEHFKSCGATSVRVTIRPDELRQWCDARGLLVNAKSRTAYAFARYVAPEHDA